MRRAVAIGGIVYVAQECAQEWMAPTIVGAYCYSSSRKPWPGARLRKNLSEKLRDEEKAQPVNQWQATGFTSLSLVPSPRYDELQADSEIPDVHNARIGLYKRRGEDLANKMYVVALRTYTLLR